jgi:hypothetical protein
MFYWRYIKSQKCAEIPSLWRFCYEIAPDVFAGVRVSWN